MKLSVIGLGKLGSPLAAVMAHKGHDVTGVDLNPEFVAALQQGRAPVEEPGLQDMINRNRERLHATSDLEAAIVHSDVTMIIVPTPSGADGMFRMDAVLQAAVPIGAALRRKRSWHVVVLCSTVMPGGTGGFLRPALEQASGLVCGRDFGLCYNPEFIALGSVIRNMLNPDMILIGESDARSGECLEGLYRGVCESEPAIRRMNFVNAELTKISVNTYVTTKISYANLLAQVCETLPGADVDVVTAALGSDTRIGAKYLKGALGYGGPCFPRDNVAFCALARRHGIQALLAEATDTLNRAQVPRIVAMILPHVPEGGTVGVAGLAYKPDTPVVEESQGLGIARALQAAGVKVVAHDPAAMESARPLLGPNIRFAATLADCAAQADVLVITTPWPQFRELRPEHFQAPQPVVIDCWRALSPGQIPSHALHITLGRGPSAREQEEAGLLAQAARA